MFLLILYCTIEAKKQILVCNYQCPISFTADKYIQTVSNSSFNDFFISHTRNDHEIDINFYSNQDNFIFKIDLSIFKGLQVTLKTSSESKMIKILYKDGIQQTFKSIDIKPNYQVIPPYMIPFKTTKSNINQLDIPEITPIPISVSIDQMVLSGGYNCSFENTNCTFDDLSSSMQNQCIKRCWSIFDNIANFSYTFKGVKFAVYGTKDPTHGHFNIELDGEVLYQIDENSDIRETFVKVFESNELEYNEHTIRAVGIGEIFEIAKFEYWPSMKAVRINMTEFASTGNWINESDGVGGIRQWTTNPKQSSKSFIYYFSKIWIYGSEDPVHGNMTVSFGSQEFVINTSGDERNDNKLLFESDYQPNNIYNLKIIPNNPICLLCVYFLDDQTINIPMSVGLSQMSVIGSTTCANSIELDKIDVQRLGCNITDLSSPEAYQCGFLCWTTNATFSYTFKGVKFGLYGTKDPDHGFFSIQVDEEPAVILSQASSREMYSLLYMSNMLEYSSHTVTISPVNGTYELYKLIYYPYFNCKRVNSTLFNKTGHWNTESDGIGGIRQYNAGLSTATGPIRCSKFWVYGITAPYHGVVKLTYNNREVEFTEYSEMREENVLVYESELLPLNTYELNFSTTQIFALNCVYYTDSITISQPNETILTNPQGLINITCDKFEYSEWGSGICVETTIADHGSYTGFNGAKATVTFFGSKVHVLAYKEQNSGKANIWIDGIIVGTPNFKSDNNYNEAGIVFTSNDLPYGEHNLTIENIGNNSEKIVFAGIYVDPLPKQGGFTLDLDDAKEYQGTWVKNATTSPPVFSSDEEGASATFRFFGTRFWITGVRGRDDGELQLNIDDEDPIFINEKQESGFAQNNKPILLYQSSELQYKEHRIKISKTYAKISFVNVMFTTYPYFSCNESIKYTFEADNLIISGIGPMCEYSIEDPAPWLSDSNLIKNVIINEGITSIGSNAFRSCTTLETITLPTSLEEIGSSAFYGCSNLISITIPERVTIIGSESFYQCSKLKTVLIYGNITTIGNNAFYECKVLSDIDLPSSVSYIGEYAFYYCKGLKSFTFPEKVTIIERSVLQYADYIQTVIILGNVTTIKSYAFYSVKYLVSIKLPESISEIKSLAFHWCTKLSTFEFPAKVTIIEDSVLSYCYSLKSVSFLGNVTSINSGAFGYCYNLQQITIPESVTYLGSSAFNRCYGLSSINITKNVNRIEQCFSDNPDLISVYYFESENPIYSGSIFSTTSVKFVYVLPEYSDDNFCGIPIAPFPGTNISYIIQSNELIITGTGAMYDYSPNNNNTAPWFANASMIKTITIHEGISTIGSYSFYLFKNFENITIPQSVTSIRPCAFSNCTKMTSFQVPEAITTIERGLFVGCSNLASINIHENVFQIESNAFANCINLETILLPTYLNKLGIGAFYECQKLKSISIPKNVTIIESKLFYSCFMLMSVIFEGDITTIQIRAFNNCYRLQNISLPKSLTTIEEYAFYSCDSFRSITIPEKVTIIPDYFIESSDNLQTVEFHGNITSIGNCAFRYCRSLLSISFPTSVEKIGWMAFESCTSLTYFEFPEKVTFISSYIFQNCANLISVSFLGNVTSIDNKAFYSCNNLREVIMPESVKQLSTNVFSYCSSLTTITIPKNVNSIESECFRYCYSLRSVYYLGLNNPSYGSNVFANTSVTCGYVLPEYQDSRFCGLPIGMFPTQIFSKTQVFSYSSIFTISEKFSSSQHFTKSHEFSSTSKFMETSQFSPSSRFIESSAFTLSLGFTDSSVFMPSSLFTGSSTFKSTSRFSESLAFSSSSKFTSSSSFTESSGFTQSSHFSSTIGFTQSSTYSLSSEFTQSSPFSPTTRFTQSSTYSLSSEFTQSSPFSPTTRFTQSSTYSSSSRFTESEKFTYSYAFSPSSTFIYEFSGTCGSDLKYGSLSKDLIITGSGAMEDYSFDSKAPWSEHSDSIEVVTIEEGVTTIGSNAFDSCTFLNNVTIANSVISIGSYAFNNCINLKSIELPNEVTKIESNCFYGCKNLFTIIIYGQITEIDDNAFYGCTLLENILFQSSSYAVRIAKNEEPITFPASLEKIGSGSFFGCERIKSIEIPTKVTTIRNATFSGCIGLISISLHSNIETIEERAFFNCSKLNDISLPTNLETLGSYAFSDCKSLQRITVPQGVNIIEESLFYRCTSLISIIIQGNVSSIKNSAFSQCESLHSIDLPLDLSEIGPSAFENCYELSSITIPEKVTTIETLVFHLCRSLSSVTFLGNVTIINDQAFSSCTDLQTLNLPDSLTTLGSSAFYFCQSLQTISIPKNVKIIGESCFSLCTSLNSVTFDGLKNPSHGDSVLNSTKVERVNVPPKYEDVDFCGYSIKYISTIAFSASNSFTSSSPFTVSSIFTESNFIGPIELTIMSGITISESVSYIESFVSVKSVTQSASFVSSQGYSYIQLENGDYSMILTSVYVYKYYPYIIYYMSPTYIQTGILLEMKVRKKMITQEQLIGVVCGSVAAFFLVLAAIILIIQRKNRANEIYESEDLISSDSSDISDVQIKNIEKDEMLNPFYTHFGI